MPLPIHYLPEGGVPHARGPEPYLYLQPQRDSPRAPAVAVMERCLVAEDVPRKALPMTKHNYTHVIFVALHDLQGGIDA